MTNISYNGILLQDVLTEDIDQQPVYDKSGADMLFMKTRVQVTATLHTLQQATLGASGGTTLSRSLSEILAKLNIPRRRFVMTIGNQTLFDVLPGAVPPGGGPVAQSLGTMDCDNGPKPQAKVLNIIGEMTARVSFTIEFNVPACTGSGNGILNLRFWIADDIDCKTWLTTRTYHGRLRLAHNHLNPHAFRDFVMPPVQGGFQPDSIQLVGSEDGLELEFTIRHSEHWAMAPNPATDWEGSHMVSSPMGVTVESEVRVKLRGAKDTPKRDLLSTATFILNNKLHLSDMQSENTSILLYAAYNDNLRENEVEAVARIKHLGKQSFVNVAGEELGQPLSLPSYNKETVTPGSPTATTAGLFLCALQTACKPGVIGKPQTQGEQVTEFEFHGPTSSIPANIVTGQLIPYETKYSQDHQAFIYTEYRESNEYDFDQGIAALSFAKASSDQAQNKDTCKIVQLYQPVAKRTVRITAERLNKWPDVPRAMEFTDNVGIKYTPESMTNEPHAPQLAADGRKTLRAVDYRITYVLSRPPGPNESLRVGKIPLRLGLSGEEEISAFPAASLKNTNGQGDSIV